MRKGVAIDEVEAAFGNGERNAEPVIFLDMAWPTAAALSRGTMARQPSGARGSR